MPMDDFDITAYAEEADGMRIRGVPLERAAKKLFGTHTNDIDTQRMLALACVSGPWKTTAEELYDTVGESKMLRAVLYMLSGVSSPVEAAAEAEIDPSALMLAVTLETGLRNVRSTKAANVRINALHDALTVDDVLEWLDSGKTFQSLMNSKTAIIDEDSISFVKGVIDAVDDADVLRHAVSRQRARIVRSRRVRDARGALERLSRHDTRKGDVEILEWAVREAERAGVKGGGEWLAED